MTPASGGPLPTRPFGRHPDRVSIIGLGGGHLSRPTVTDQEAERIIRTALDNGVTFFDNSWDYGDGVSERRYGQALAGHRDDIFLMSKVCDRTRDGALRQLDESLRRLRTDYLDLWQFHEVNYDNDPEWIFEPGGAAEAAEIAKAQGKVRYVGFTGHKSPHIFKGMLAADYEWDACQMPVSVFDHQYRSFTADILPELKRRGIACIGMKSLGGSGQFVTEAGLTPQELRALRPVAADHVTGVRRRVRCRRVAGPRDRPHVHPAVRGRAAGPARSGAARGHGRTTRVVQDIDVLRLEAPRSGTRVRQPPDAPPLATSAARMCESEGASLVSPMPQ